MDWKLRLWQAQPRWLKRLELFLGILWRESPGGGRMDWETARDVAYIMWPKE